MALCIRSGSMFEDERTIPSGVSMPTERSDASEEIVRAPPVELEDEGRGESALG